MIQDDLPKSDEEALAYRSLSTQAILGVVLALLSPLAFVMPLFLVVPLAGAVISCAAALAINRSPERLTGQGLALAGLFLSVVVGSAAYSSTLAKASLHRLDAERLVQEFVAALAEKNYPAACELTRPLALRLAEGEDVRSHYAEDEEADKRLEAFLQSGAAAAMASPPPPQLVYDGTPTRVTGGAIHYTRIYRVQSAERERFVKLALSRETAFDGTSSWYVSSCDFTRMVD